MTEVNETYGCILSKFYIKPQQRIRHKIGHSVVSYRNSTSNHNRRLCLSRMSPVVSYRNSTSNHNASMPSSSGPSLYLIEILHQTTTRHPGSIPVVGCILSKFYIKPQCSRASIFQRCCCILSKFYIKPQRFSANVYNIFVVSYRNSTSNHNNPPFFLFGRQLYLIEILHQTTTPFAGQRCCALLYLIEILHQTTTLLFCYTDTYWLYLIEILHQTTTTARRTTST